MATTQQSILDRYLAQFRTNAISWSHATDEIRDLAREIRQFHNDRRSITIEAINFRMIATPSQWNITARNEINRIFAKLTESEQIEFVDNHVDEETGCPLCDPKEPTCKFKEPLYTAASLYALASIRCPLPCSTG